MLGVGTLGWVAKHSSDLEAVDESGLLPEPRTISASENAYFALESAVALLNWPQEHEAALAELDAHVKGETWDSEFVGAFLERNRESLQLIRAVDSLPGLAFPALEPGSDPDIVGWLRVCRLLALQGEQHARAERSDEALASFALLFQLAGEIVRADNVTVLHAQVGYSMTRRGLRSIQASLRFLEPTPTAARQFGSRIARALSRADDWERMWAGEYQWMKRALEPAAEQMIGERPAVRGLIAASYLYQPNRTAQLIADRAVEFQALANQPCTELVEPDEPEFGFRERMRLVLGPNGVGQILLGIWEPSVARYQASRCYATTTIAASQVLVALAAYRAERGSLPEQLAALVPDYLEELPADGFAAAPLGYSQEDRVLNSAAEEVRPLLPAYAVIPIQIPL